MATRMWEVGANDQIFKAVDYQPLLVAYHNGTAVRISDIGKASIPSEDIRNAGYANGKPSVLVILFRQPGPTSSTPWTASAPLLPQTKGSHPAVHRHEGRHGPDRSPFAPRSTTRSGPS